MNFSLIEKRDSSKIIFLNNLVFICKFVDFFFCNLRWQCAKYSSFVEFHLVQSVNVEHFVRVDRH